ncbi:uncharacterized protein TNIN_487111 [Trichonephila inaurata madagascariensis]|uniref:Uncharacterized protein n=1 Tax=Trichonephila inaurata madagascariensis TaxID=2747483 RepID=A0A8X6ILX4_9ARAC|nr:uncharacterized protein TNIN_487111 [Trichonephila inaurata madagascariensis]
MVSVFWNVKEILLKAEQLQVNINPNFLTSWMPKFVRGSLNYRRKKNDLSEDNALVHKGALAMGKQRGFRRVPAALLAAISERLGPDVHPEDTIVVEMSAENMASKMRHAFTVQELQEIVSRYEEQLSRIYTKAASVER